MSYPFCFSWNKKKRKSRVRAAGEPERHPPGRVDNFTSPLTRGDNGRLSHGRHTTGIWISKMCSSRDVSNLHILLIKKIEYQFHSTASSSCGAGRDRPETTSVAWSGHESEDSCPKPLIFGFFYEARIKTEKSISSSTGRATFQTVPLLPSGL